MESTAKLVNVTREKDALTANYALTNSTSLNSVVDLFFIAGASRNMTPDSIENMLEKAWIEDSLLTLKCIFWAGDIRGGAGERRFFRIALNWLHFRFENVFTKNFKQVPEFNRWDSLFNFQEKQVLDFIYKALKKEKNGLCAKWMPRKKQYNNLANLFRKTFKLSPKEYRDMIVGLSNTVEQKMCSKEWDKIEYKGVPSVAMNRYKAAFIRNDETRFNMYIGKVIKGETTIHAGAIFPYDIYESVEKYHAKEVTKDSIVAQWNALPNYMIDSKEQILPICDVSGSMSGRPMAISVSLGIYLSERNTGIFKDAFVTFSGNPKMQYLKGDLIDRMQQLENSDWGMNTDLNQVFKMILSKAVSNKLKPSDMPTMLLIISDMEFDSCADLTNYEAIVKDYDTAGYKIPRIVFWNVNGRQGNVPVQAKVKDVALVSGASPAIMTSILGGKDFSPAGIMKETLNKERYACLTI